MLLKYTHEKGELMKPMIFFDVDGTLMDNHDYQVTPSTKKALQKLQENGY